MRVCDRIWSSHALLSKLVCNRVQILICRATVAHTYETDAACHKHCSLAHCTPFADLCEYRHHRHKRSALVSSCTKLCGSILQCQMARTASGTAPNAEPLAHVPKPYFKGTEMPPLFRARQGTLASFPARSGIQLQSPAQITTVNAAHHQVKYPAGRSLTMGSLAMYQVSGAVPCMDCMHGLSMHTSDSLCAVQATAC